MECKPPKPMFQIKIVQLAIFYLIKKMEIKVVRTLEFPNKIKLFQVQGALSNITMKKI